MGNKRIVIGCDHAGYPLKAELLKHLSARGIEYTDIGCDSAEKSVDYPEFADKLCRELQAGNADLGILVCGTGIGVSLAANKVRGAYCALLADPYSAQRATLSNNANMIAMGEQTTGIETAKVLLTEYLANTFDPNSRSGVKVERIREIEAENL